MVELFLPSHRGLIIPYYCLCCNYVRVLTTYSLRITHKTPDAAGIETTSIGNDQQNDPFANKRRRNLYIRRSLLICMANTRRLFKRHQHFFYPPNNHLSYPFKVPYILISPLVTRNRYLRPPTVPHDLPSRTCTWRPWRKTLRR